MKVPDYRETKKSYYGGEKWFTRAFGEKRLAY